MKRCPPAPPLPSKTSKPGDRRSVACATQPFIDSHFPHPDAQLGMSTFTSPFKPLAYGQVAVTIPQVGSEQNVFNATNAAQSTSCPSSITTTANTWSVQQNVNDWTIAAGPNKDDFATVQFVTQSDGSTTGICIWQIDVTTQEYPNKCYSPPPSQRSGGLQAFDYGNIAATVEGRQAQDGCSNQLGRSGRSQRLRRGGRRHLRHGGQLVRGWRRPPRDRQLLGGASSPMRRS